MGPGARAGDGSGVTQRGGKGGGPSAGTTRPAHVGCRDRTRTDRNARGSPNSLSRWLQTSCGGIFASGRPAFAGFAVRVLAAQDIPQADAAFAAGLETDLEGTLPLVAMFGTAQLAGQMNALYRAVCGVRSRGSFSGLFPADSIRDPGHTQQC